MEMMLPEAVVQTSARQAALVWSPHPLLASEGRVIAFDAPTGAESLHDYLIRLGVDLSGPVIVSVDRAVIPREWLTRVRPKPGTLITVRAAVAGGGDGSQVVAIVAMIAISVMAPYLAGAAYGLATSGTALTMAQSAVWAANTAIGMAMTTGITIAGSMAISALMPKPKVDLGNSMSSAKSSATYSLSGGSNQPRPYEPLGLTLGRHRVFFDLASRPYSTMVGKESYLSQVFHVGMHGPHGPVRVEDLRIGDTPLTDYQDVEVEFSYDEMPQLVAYNVDTAAGSAITVAGGPLLRTTSVDTTRIEVDLQALLFYTGDSGIQERAVTLRAEYRPVAGGAWMPFAVEYQVGYYTHYWSHGSFESYDGAESGGVSTYYVQDSFDANRSPAAHVDGVGGWYWRQYSKIYSDPSPPSYELVLAAEFTLYNSGTSPVHRTYSINVPKGQYEIRISRVSPDETNQRATSEVSVTSIKSFQNQDGNFVGQCFMAVKVRASGQLNGTLATLSGVVSQPVGAGNYSSIAADVYLLFARGYRVGGRLIWGAGLGDDELDLPAIAAWRAWCVTKNLTFNAQIDSNKSVWDILQAIARCGRGSPSWGTGKLGVLWDAEGQPVIALFGPANIKRGTFEISYNSGVAADEVLLNFVNAAKNYDADFVRLSAPGVVSPIKPAAVELWGCTDMDMAVRDCRLQVAHQTYRTRSVTWLTDMEGLVVTRGDVVALSHDLTQWGVSGRLVGGTATVLQLDRAITLDPVANWITVVQPDGEMITSRIQYLAGEHDTVTLLDALPVAPDSDNPMDWRYLADYQPTPGKRVKIVDIQPASMHEVRITAMDDPDEYYAAEAGAYSPPAVRKWTADAPTVSGLQFSEELVRAGSGYAVILTVGWSETGDIAARGVRYSINGGALQSVAVDGPECRLTIPDTGTVTVTVNAYTAAGQSSTAATRTAIHTIVGQDIPPPNVSGFAVSTLADGTRAFVWTVASVAADITYVEIRYAASSGTAWGSMMPLGRIPYTLARTESVLPASGTWTFEARLLDDSSNYSAVGTRVTATLGAAPAAAAQAAADAANAKHVEIASDYKLSPLEKQAGQKEWAEIVGSYGGIDGQAAGWLITTERTAHTDWYNLLSGYLAPLFANTAVTSDIDGPTYRWYWSSYYAARQTLLNKIAAVAATTATWSGVAGNGKPLDNAGRVLDLGTGTGAGQRQANDAPGWYAVGTAQQFKWSASVGLPFGEWGVLRTERAYGDDAAPVIQTWKSEQGQWARKGYLSGWSAWGRIWDRTLDASNVSYFVSDSTFGYRELANGAATGIGELGLLSLSTNFYYRRPLLLAYTPATTCTGVLTFSCEASPLVLSLDIEIYVSSQAGLPPDDASTSGGWTIAQVDAFKAGAVPGMLRRSRVSNGEFGSVSMEVTVGLFAGQQMEWGVMVYQAGGSVSAYNLKNMRIKIEELRS